MTVARETWRAAYFAFQGCATLAWWIMLAAVPACRRWFAFGDDGGSLLQFLPADLVFWVLGSWFAAWGELTGKAWRRGMQHVLGGGLACSLVQAATAAALTGTGVAGVLLMLPAVVTTWCLACRSVD